MALPHSSRLQFLSRAGLPVTRPAEWSPAYIEIRELAPEGLGSDVQLLLRGLTLPLVARRFGDAVRVVAEWPPSDPGRHRIELFEHGSRTEIVETRVDPLKITPGQFEQLLEDVSVRLPASIALSLQHMGALTGVRLLHLTEATLAEEVKRLGWAVNGTSARVGLAKVLPQLQKEPHRMLVKEEVWVDRSLARRPEPTNLVRAMWRPYNLDADTRPVAVLDTRVEHTTDVYENRMVKAFVNEVGIRLRRLLRQVPPDSTLSLELDMLLQTLHRANHQAPFLDEVNLLTAAPSKLTMVLLRRPAYRAALEGYIELHRSLAALLEDPTLEAPLDNLPHLYEVWATMRVIDAALNTAADLGYQVALERLTRRAPGYLYVRVLADGRPAVELMRPSDGQSVRIIPQRSYPRGGKGLHSISFQQRPDVAVEINRQGDREDLYLFDPKYKLDSESIAAQDPAAAELLEELDAETPDVIDPGLVRVSEPGMGRPKKIDIDKMHTYRDAIRDSHDKRIARYAAILYPGEYCAFHPDLEALSAIPGGNDGLDHHLNGLMEDWFV